MQKGLRKIILIPLYILGFLFIGLVSGYLTFKVMSFSKTVEVPDLRGKSVIEANDILSRKGLYLRVEGEEFDLAVSPGLIARQDIPPGNKVKEERGIKVFLSKGPKFRVLPDITGQTLNEAEAVVSKSGLRVDRIIRVHSDSVEKDRVIAQRPAPDEQTKEALSLIVSAGPYDIIYICPDFTGRSVDDASGLAEKLGLKVEFSGQGGRVRAQKPKPGAFIKSGETLHIQLEGETHPNG